MDENKKINNIISSYEWEERYRKYMLKKFNLSKREWELFWVIEDYLDLECDDNNIKVYYEELKNLGISVEKEREILEECKKYYQGHPYPKSELDYVDVEVPF